MHFIHVILATGLSTVAQTALIRRQTAGKGTGPYTPAYTTESGLSTQTIYMPTNAPANVKLPVVLYGVGGCMDSGTMEGAFLHEVASHGYLVIANNGPTSRGQVQADTLIKAADWVDKVAGTGKYASVDKSRMIVTGWSCGGLQAYTVGNDPRFAAIGILSSGQFSEADSKAVAAKVTKPIFYFMGGSSDVAYPNGNRDYAYLPKSTPAWIGQDNKGHGHEFTKTYSGVIGNAFVIWVDWILKGNTTASTFFTNNAEATAAGWTEIKSQSLDKIKVTPI